VTRVSPDDWRRWRELRLAALADAPAAFNSKLADWQDADEDRWRRRLLDAPVNLIADLDGRPAGMASGTTTGDATEREVISLWVAPFARGRGIATALVLAVVGWARDAGARRVVLEVKADNDAARALYRRLRFVDAGDVDGRSDLRRMTRSLDAPIAASDLNAVSTGDVYGTAPLYSEATFAAHVRCNEIDLERSVRLDEDGGLVALALLAIRDARAWIGGFGVIPHARGRGVGRRCAEAAMGAARTVGATSLELEVLGGNAAARRLYERVGFVAVDELDVWERTAAGEPRTLELVERSERDVRRIGPAPTWQREARTVARSGPSAEISVAGGRAFIVPAGPTSYHVLDVEAENDRAARELCDRLAIGRSMRLLNESRTSLFSSALAKAGWRVAHRQLRMRIRL